MNPKETKYIYHNLKPMEILVIDDIAVPFFFMAIFLKRWMVRKW